MSIQVETLRSYRSCWR